MAARLFGRLQQTPGYICTSDGSIHVNIVVVSAILALDAILADTKMVWFSGHALTESVVFWTRSQMRSWKTRSTTIGLLLHARKHFQLSRKDPMRAMPNPFRKALAKKISALCAGGALHSLDCFASQLYTSAAPLPKYNLCRCHRESGTPENLAPPCQIP